MIIALLSSAHAQVWENPCKARPVPPLHTTLHSKSRPPLPVTARCPDQESTLE